MILLIAMGMAAVAGAGAAAAVAARFLAPLERALAVAALFRRSRRSRPWQQARPWQRARYRRRQYPFDVDAFIRFDDDARVEFFCRHLVDIQSIGILTVVQADDIQSVPVDEIVMKRVIDGMELFDIDIPRKLQRGAAHRAGVGCHCRAGCGPWGASLVAAAWSLRAAAIVRAGAAFRSLVVDRAA